jgi:hypothetical protein
MLRDKLKQLNCVQAVPAQFALFWVDLPDVLPREGLLSPATICALGSLLIGAVNTHVDIDIAP